MYFKTPILKKQQYTHGDKILHTQKLQLTLENQISASSKTTETCNTAMEWQFYWLSGKFKEKSKKCFYES